VRVDQRLCFVGLVVGDEGLDALGLLLLLRLDWEDVL
jgi:hypothetical protein